MVPGETTLLQSWLSSGFARRFALTCGVRPEHVEDFLHDVAVTALQRIQDGAFRPEPDRPLRESVRAWLSGIVRFKALDAGRMAAFRAQVMVAGPMRENPIDVDVAVPSPARQILAREELAAIARLKLSPKQREAVALAAEGYTAKEVGQRLGVPEDTAATYLKRARKAWNAAREGRRQK